MASPASVGAGVSSGHRAPPETPRRRNTELLLLVFAAVLVTGALTLVEANQEQTLSGQIVYYGVVYLALLLAAHFVVRRYAPYADPLILPCVALLNGLGLVMIHRLDLAEGNPASLGIFGGDAAKQVLWTFLGIALFAVVLVVIRDHRTLARYGYTFGLVGMFALALPGLLPAKLSEVHGSKAWLKLGFASIQPGEFAKILLMIFFAAFLVAKRDLFLAAGRRFLGLELPRARDLGPLIVAFAGAVGVLVLEKDLGNSLLVFGVVLVMLYVATERAAWLIIGLVPFIGACFLAYRIFGHVQQRVANWIDPFATYDQLGGGGQLAQSLFSLGTGGVAGSGLGAGRPNLVPLANSDFIIAAIGEELGLIGLTALLMIYALVALRGLRSALAVRDTFGKLLAGGLAFSMAWQVFVVVGGVTKLIPETGLTSPFLSAGGSSLLANWMLVGLLLRISDTARRPRGTSKPKVAQVPLADAGTVLVERPQ